MKSQILHILLLVTLGLSACTANPPGLEETAETVQPTSQSVSAEKQILNTAMGEFEVSYVRFVEEANGVKPGPEEKLLLIGLTRPGLENLDPGNFSLEEFQNMIQDTNQGTIHLLGEDGSQTISSMAGWVSPEYKEFALGFRLPSTVTAYQLAWPGNDPLAIIPEN